MRLNGDAKYMTLNTRHCDNDNCGFKNGLKNQVKFNQSTQKYKKLYMMRSFCPKHIMFQLENFGGIMFHDTEE